MKGQDRSGLTENEAPGSPPNVHWRKLDRAQGLGGGVLRLGSREPHGGELNVHWEQWLDGSDSWRIASFVRRTSQHGSRPNRALPSPLSVSTDSTSVDEIESVVFLKVDWKWK